MSIEKRPFLQRLRELERERDKIQKWLVAGEYVNKGRLERRLYKLKGMIERQEYRLEILRKRDSERP